MGKLYKTEEQPRVDSISKRIQKYCLNSNSIENSLRNKRINELRNILGIERFLNEKQIYDSKNHKEIERIEQRIREIDLNLALLEQGEYAN